MVERFRRSGKTRGGFRESEGIAKSTLDWWLRRKRKKGPRKKRLGFRELAVVATGIGVARDWSMEIVSPRGWTIRSRQPLSMDDIARLLREPGC